MTEKYRAALGGLKNYWAHPTPSNGPPVIHNISKIHI